MEDKNKHANQQDTESQQVVTIKGMQLFIAKEKTTNKTQNKRLTTVVANFATSHQP